MDHAAIKRAYLQVDSALATALKAAVKTLVAQLVPADVQAHPKAIRELTVPAAWRARVQAEARRSLVVTYQAGAASARAELAKGSRKFDLAPQDLPEWIDTLAYNLSQSLGEDVVKALRAIWANALAQDWSVGKLQEVLAGALAGYQDASGGDITPARIATIVRTTNTNAFNQARMDVFSDPSLDGFVEALEYSAILDDRTTPLCEYLDGRTYALDDEFWTDYMPPNHFNCRSLAIPVVQGDDWEQSDPPKAGMEPADGFSV